MAFNKFEPHRNEPKAEATVGERRAAILAWGWRITLLNTLFGFLMIAYFMFWR